MAWEQERGKLRVGTRQDGGIAQTGGGVSTPHSVVLPLRVSSTIGDRSSVHLQCQQVMAAGQEDTGDIAASTVRNKKTQTAIYTSALTNETHHTALEISSSIPCPAVPSAFSYICPYSPCSASPTKSARSQSFEMLGHDGQI